MTDERDGLVPTLCPHCNYKLDAATCTSDPGERPRPGDISVCLNCEGLLQYTSTSGAVAKIAFAELPVKVRREIQHIQKVMRKVKHVYGRRN